MKNKKIVIAGGTGFIGEEMTKHFGKENTVIILTRQIKHSITNRNEYSSLKNDDLRNVQYVKWDGKTTGGWIKHIDGADMIINLAGRSVNCRYTDKNKKEIFDSRTDAVKAIGQAVAQCSFPPALWINASSATIYRHAPDRPQDEFTGEFHDDFSVQVCKRWEKTFFEQSTPQTRKIALRMAITIGPGGILIPFFNLIKFGLAGHQGNGRQMFSWIHIYDLCRIIEWIDEHQEMEGVYNCSSPNPVTNHTLMKTLREVTGHPSGLPAYKWMLKIGAALIGTETELILKSRWVAPTRLLQTGFTFTHPDLKEALTDIINKVPRKQYRLF